MWISLRRQIEKVFTRFQLDKCRAVATPQALGPLSLPATSDDEDVNNPNVPYCAMVDCMQYLVQCTRPDLANAVRALGKYLNNYTHENYRTAKRVLRYLRGASDFGLVWGKKESPDLHLVVYPDADLGNEKDDKHLITGYVLKLNGCTCAYKSRKQRSVADDTCCAEFVAASECPTMIVWTHNLCNELNLTRYYPTVLYQDNQATITVLTEVDGNYKTKSVDVKYHKVRDFHERGEFEELYRPSSENLADIFTKALGPTQFRKFRQQLNVMPLLTAIEDSKAGGRN
ncbi:Retrovirus-related Gag-pol Polyprotein [Phytophthora cinnamomi]|uniref:Retrovirus-related Gag-pol Polyprotein n=1 Tax=Phytophthora cinnamomi TaxID=4785 RepID=UPI00355947D7|nr:Retrovirus-related Gag-pol Polyprotein [Phytophthora cinnamomi]